MQKNNFSEGSVTSSNRVFLKLIMESKHNQRRSNIPHQRMLWLIQCYMYMCVRLCVHKDSNVSLKLLEKNLFTENCYVKVKQSHLKEPCPHSFAVNLLLLSLLKQIERMLEFHFYSVTVFTTAFAPVFAPGYASFFPCKQLFGCEDGCI